MFFLPRPLRRIYIADLKAAAIRKCLFLALCKIALKHCTAATGALKSSLENPLEGRMAYRCSIFWKITSANLHINLKRCFEFNIITLILLWLISSEFCSFNKEINGREFCATYLRHSARKSAYYHLKFKDTRVRNIFQRTERRVLKLTFGWSQIKLTRRCLYFLCLWSVSVGFDASPIYSRGALIFDHFHWSSMEISIKVEVGPFPLKFNGNSYISIKV